MSTIKLPITACIIDSRNDVRPLYVWNTDAEAQDIYDHYHDRNTNLVRKVKVAAGYDPDTPLFVGVYADCMIDPITGGVLEDPNGPSKAQFLAHCFNRYFQTMEDAEEE